MSIVVPEFCSKDLVDPITGQNNSVEPPQIYKHYGWHPFRFRPPRQYFNWIHRSTYLYFSAMSRYMCENLPAMSSRNGGSKTIFNFGAANSSKLLFWDIRGPMKDQSGEYILYDDSSIGFTFTKDYSNTWEVGDNGGGRGDALPQTYEWTNIFMLGNPETGKVDIGFDSDIQGLNLLAISSLSGFTSYRRICSWLFLDTGFDNFGLDNNVFTINEYNSSHVTLNYANNQPFGWYIKDLESTITGTPRMYPNTDIMVRAKIDVNTGPVAIAGSTSNNISALPFPQYEFSNGGYYNFNTGDSMIVDIPIRNSQFWVNGPGAYDFDFTPISFKDLGTQNVNDT